ncbi:hypothetical protein ACU7RR_002309 [Providencia stuartii]|nr:MULTISPECIES: hypothetical protein [Providencia]MDE8747090.1 hypothetical protein [Providencia thailandensis]MDE8765691.1 hypothetical protein [Providencia thailandensis]MDE8782337.1 hypothetical protein [Providencia thailandensis]MDT7046251.1 hypothetical protein [Providencia stuartii]
MDTKRWLVISMLLSLSSTVLGATDRYDDYLSRINSICKKHPEPANCEDEVNILLQNVLMNGDILSRCEKEEETGTISTECKNFADFWMYLTK